LTRRANALVLLDDGMSCEAIVGMREFGVCSGWRDS
jgi:hypothetical protein